MWALSESDIENIGALSTVATLLYSVGGFFVGGLVNIFVATSVSPSQLSETGRLLQGPGIAFCVLLAIGSFSAGVFVTLKKNSVMRRIKAETKQVPLA